MLYLIFCICKQREKNVRFMNAYSFLFTIIFELHFHDIFLVFLPYVRKLCMFKKFQCALGGLGAITSTSTTSCLKRQNVIKARCIALFPPFAFPYYIFRISIPFIFYLSLRSRETKDRTIFTFNLMHLFFVKEQLRIIDYSHFSAHVFLFFGENRIMYLFSICRSNVYIKDRNGTAEYGYPKIDILKRIVYLQP